MTNSTSTTIETGGGIYIGGDAQAGRDLIGRDQNIYGATPAQFADMLTRLFGLMVEIPQARNVLLGARQDAINKGNAAATAQAEAERQTQIALVRQLAAQSDAAVAISYPRSLLLALAAVQGAQRVTPTLPLAAADSALHARLEGQPGSTPLVGHDSAVWSVAFSGDGQWLASGSNDNTLRVWRVGEWEAEPVVLRGHDSAVWSVAFSGDGQWLASGSDDKTLRVWTVPLARLVELACRLSGRNFTQAEWQQYFGAAAYQVTCPEWPAHPSVAEAVVAEGRNLAQQGDVAGATAKFEQALQLDPGLGIEPEKEAKQVAAQGLLAQGQDLAQKGDVAGATAKFEQALQLDPGLGIEPDKEARQVATAASLVDEGRNLAQQGDVTGATAKFKQALQLDPGLGIEPQLFAQIEWGRGLASSGAYTEAMSAFAAAQTISSTLQITASLSANEWNGICWDGALAGAARAVLPACERAVALAPNDGAIRDSRGLARALTGDVTGAIADFEFAVQYLKKQSGWETVVAKREALIAALKAGKRPDQLFDAKTMEELLRNE